MGKIRRKTREIQEEVKLDGQIEICREIIYSMEAKIKALSERKVAFIDWKVALLPPQLEEAKPLAIHKEAE